MGDNYLIYDDSCPVCRASIKRVQQLDKLGIVRLVRLSQLSEINDVKLPALSELKEQIHFITADGMAHKGAEAIGHLAGLFPQSRLLGRILSLPGVKQIARPLYRLIARHRLKLSNVFGFK
jgi:predicted DCC family thiol-disulfide oxidoreductase YuxK